MSICQNRSRDSAGKHSAIRGVTGVPFKVLPPSGSSSASPGTAFARNSNTCFIRSRGISLLGAELVESCVWPKALNPQPSPQRRICRLIKTHLRRLLCIVDIADPPKKLNQHQVIFKPANLPSCTDWWNPNFDQILSEQGN